MTALVIVAALAAAAASGLRWLRVAQREHYLPGAASRFAWRWWSTGRNPLLGLVVVAAVATAAFEPPVGLAAAAALAVGPSGLTLAGRTSRLVWTRRLRTLAAVWAGLHLLLVAVGGAAGAGPLVALIAAVITPVLVDIALAVVAPVERRLAVKWVKRAADRLRQVAPRVVAITGSYGKTTTKGYVAHLVGATRPVVASPASFNNLSGLARAVNEHLTPGTEVFVAEMGTYGPGEIAELCRWFPPDIAVICAIGPVHLERMGSEEAIVAAKAEILGSATTVVLNIDHPGLALLADSNDAAGRRVRRCSSRSSPDAGVAVVDGRLVVDGSTVADVAGVVDGSVHPGNLACAVAVALELGVPEAVVVERLVGLPTPPNRLTVSTAASGATVLDDTYNSNPAGTTAALAALVRHGGAGNRRVV
ncbi:MAG: Mur ligase family protein, partial [Acidimicrobiales bacterium]